MENQILELLQQLNNKIENIEKSQKEIKDEIVLINKKLDGVVEQTADLVEFRSEIITKVDSIRKDITNVEVITASNWQDIAKLKAVK